MQAYPELSTKKTTSIDLNDLGMLGEELGDENEPEEMVGFSLPEGAKRG